MKRTHRVYLFRKPFIVTALISFIFSGMAGWLLYLPQASILPATELILGADALVSCLLIALVVGSILLPHGEQKIRRAQLPPVARRSKSRSWIHRLPQGNVARSVVVGLGMTLIMLPLVMGMAHLTAETGVSLNQFVLMRAGLSAIAAGTMAAALTWIGLVGAS